MKRLMIAALCAVAMSFAARADDQGSGSGSAGDGSAAAAAPAGAPPAAAAPAAPAEGSAAAAAPAAGSAEAGKFPHLEKAKEHLAAAKADLEKAKEAHKDKGTLGGHAAKAIGHVDAATKHVEEAIAFAEKHPAKAGKHPGKPHGEFKAHPEKLDAKFENLGNARKALQEAQFQLTQAMAFHKPIGALGGHDAKAQSEIKNAYKEIGAAEKFAEKEEHKAGKKK